MATSADSPLDCSGCEGVEPTAGNYFVSTYPPFSAWNREQVVKVPHVLGHESSAQDSVPLGIYVHVPFCAECCHYCYYRSYDKPTREQTDQYVDTVLKELAGYAQEPAVAGRSLDFLYFGGGTPSLLSASQIRRLLEGVLRLFPFDSAREITFECAPQSATRDRLMVLGDLDITRISVGVQQ